MFRFSPVGSDCEADFGAPGPKQRIGPGPRTSTSRPRSAPNNKGSRSTPSPDAYVRAIFRLIQYRAGHGPPIIDILSSSS